MMIHMGLHHLLVHGSEMKTEACAIVSPAGAGAFIGQEVMGMVWMDQEVMGMQTLEGESMGMEAMGEEVMGMEAMEGEVMGMEATGEEMMGMEVEAMVEAMEAMEAMVGETMTSTFGREGAFAQFIAEGRSLMQSCIKRSAHL